MAVEHSSISDPNIHEPKGVGTASADQVYVADGGGSGNWTSVGDLNVNGLGEVVLTVEMDDVSAASSAWVVCPYSGTITKIYSVLHTAITGSDAGITVEIGGTAVTNGDITIAQSGSAAGDVDSATPTANNTVSQGQAIEVISDGASSTTARATFTIVVDVS